MSEVDHLDRRLEGPVVWPAGRLGRPPRCCELPRCRREGRQLRLLGRRPACQQRRIHRRLGQRRCAKEDRVELRPQAIGAVREGHDAALLGAAGLPHGLELRRVRPAGFRARPRHRGSHRGSRARETSEETNERPRRSSATTFSVTTLASARSCTSRQHMHAYAWRRIRPYDPARGALLSVAEELYSRQGKDLKSTSHHTTRTSRATLRAYRELKFRDRVR